MSDVETSTRAQILETAMHLLRGNAKVPFTLTQLAEHLEMHHTAVYHYFESKDHLVSELIEAICARRLTNLQRAHSDGTALDQLLEFIRLELNEPPTDLLVRPTFLLKSPYREKAESLLDAVTEAIEQQVLLGLSDGSIRQCSVRTVAKLLVKLINRYSNRQETMLSRSGLSASAIAEEVTRIIRNGVAAGAAPVERVSSLTPVPFPKLSRRQEQLDVVQQALTEAFNRQGFVATSIPRVAASIGVSKTSIYKFAENKADLLYLCVRNTFDLIGQARQVATAVSGSPLEGLMYNMYYLRQLEGGPPGPLLQSFLYQYQSPIAQLVTWDIFERQRDNILELFERGIEQGEIRPLEPAAAVPAHSVYASWAEEPAGFSDEIAQLFLTGIAAR